MDNNQFTVSVKDIIERGKKEGLSMDASSLAAYRNFGAHSMNAKRVGIRPYDIPPKLIQREDWDYIGKRCMHTEEAVEKILIYKRGRLQRKNKQQKEGD